LHIKTNIYLSYLTQFSSDEEVFLTGVLEKTKTQRLCSIPFFPPFENRAVYDKIISELEGHKLQYGTCALHAVYL